MCVSNSDVLSRWQAIRAKAELEFCAADYRAGRTTISPGEMEWGGPSLACIQKVGEGVFHLATAEAGEGGGRGGGSRMRNEAVSDPSPPCHALCGGAVLTP